MEKLLKLLNEYEKKTAVHWYEWYGEDVLMCRYIEDNFEFYTDEATTIAISKYYGFIKRLVENGKIDKKKFEDKFFICGCCGYKLLSTRETCEACGDEVLDIYEALLMQLAIQDEPIDFLISILK